ncbi:MAG: 4-hydroxy-3-methylbut-2-enyl diphosphate reductase, partial [Muribaculaceae bacterium]|nr:4-hydroxy-3-methylbut-2-enyl diphosphate reductase [Muribaculaceae bacterium]
TCPVVLKLQQRVKAAYDRPGARPQIVIYGKLGHAEVNGLVGQTNGQAIVVENIGDLDKLDYRRDIALFSQTTKSLEGYNMIIEEIRRRKTPEAEFEHYDTICRSVSGRVERLRSFAAAHEVVLFVAGTKSSNGRILYDQCLNVNPRTHLIANASHLDPDWLEGAESVGICGATSTPLWLMEQVRDTAAEIMSADE